MAARSRKRPRTGTLSGGGGRRRSRGWSRGRGGASSVWRAGATYAGIARRTIINVADLIWCGLLLAVSTLVAARGRFKIMSIYTIILYSVIFTSISRIGITTSST